MPRGKDYSQLDKLKEIGVALDDDQEYMGFRVKQRLKCLVCNEGKWTSSVQIVSQQHKNLGSTGCPVCKIGHGENSRKRRREKFDIDQRLEEAGAELIGEYVGLMQHSTVKCMKCGHQWETSINNILSAYQAKVAAGRERTNMCPACHRLEIEQKIITARTNNLTKLADLGYSVIGNIEFEKEEDQNTPTVTFLRHECGHVFDASLHNVLGQLTKCPVCYQEALEEARNNKPGPRILSEDQIAQLNEYAQYSYRVRLLTDVVKKQNASIIDPDRLRRGKSYGDDWVVDHRASIRACYYAGISIEEASSIDNLQLIPAYENGTKSWKVMWDVVPETFVDRIKSKLHIIDPAQYLIEKLGENGVEFGSLHRKTANYAYSFVARDIVFRVLISNRSEYTEGKAVMNAMKYFNDLGYRSVQILDVEIKQNPELIVSKVMNILGYNKSITKVFARKLDVRVLDRDDDKAKLRDLLNANHVQGDRASSVKIGGFYKGKLIAAMCFNRATKMTSNKIVGDRGWDLSRFVTDVDYSVPGGASRLLAYFERNFEWTSIVSHADKRWSTGDMYRKLGFEMFDSGDPGYFYIWNGQRYSRNYFAKSNLAKIVQDYDPALPESHYAEMLGALKVYDCGVYTCLKVK
jgi:DNA-directed RNA polymerase subunit M/transcription elongation factor TFIIS